MESDQIVEAWVSKKFSLDCVIPDNDYSSIGLIEKI